MKTVLIAALLLAHSFYPEACCGGKDCKPVPCEEITRMPDGDYLWQHAGDRVLFLRARMKRSEDDQCHVCVAKNLSPAGICLFLAPRA